MNQYEQINTRMGVYYLAPPEWTLTAVYKWLKARNYHDFGIIGILGNIARESGGFPFAYEYAYDTQITKECAQYPKLNIDYNSETWSTAPATTFQYWRGMKAYGENLDNGVMSESEFVHQRIDGAVTGFGFMQWSDDPLKQRLYDMTIKRGLSAMDVIAQCECIEETIKNSSSQWFANLNPELTYQPWEVMHNGRYEFAYRGRYPWYAYERWYNDDYPDRIACAFMCNYIEKPVASVASDERNYTINNNRYVTGKCWLEFCKLYADRFDHSVLGIDARKGLKVWQYPVFMRR